MRNRDRSRCSGEQLSRVDRRWLAAWVVVALMVAACGDAERDADMDEPSEETPAETASEPVEDTLVNVSVQDLGMTEEPVDGRLLVIQRGLTEPLTMILNVQNLEQGEHAWDVHSGTCEQPGPVAVALSETEDMDAEVGPLHVDQTGQVDLDLEVAALTGVVSGADAYALHIHESPGIVHGDTIPEPVTVACADLWQAEDPN